MTRADNNRENEAAFLEKLSEGTGKGTSWERISALIELENSRTFFDFISRSVGTGWRWRQAGLGKRSNVARGDAGGDQDPCSTWREAVVHKDYGLVWGSSTPYKRAPLLPLAPCR